MLAISLSVGAIVECTNVIELSFAGVCLDTGVRVYEPRAQSKVCSQET